MLEILGGVATNADAILGRIPGHSHQEMKQLFNNLNSEKLVSIRPYLRIMSQQPESTWHFRYNVRKR